MIGAEGIMNMYIVKQLTPFLWGIIDTETGEVVIEDTYYGIQAMREIFGC